MLSGLTKSIDHPSNYFRSQSRRFQPGLGTVPRFSLVAARHLRPCGSPWLKALNTRELLFLSTKNEVGKHSVLPWLYLAAQGTYYLLGNCTSQPDIGSLSRVVLLMSG